MIRASLLAGAALLLAAAGSASAQFSPAARPRLSAAWPVLDQARDEDCTLAITGNGRFMQVIVSGLIPGEAVRFAVVNGDMTPIRLTAYADRTGQFRKYYIPFRFNRERGIVGVMVGAARCNLTGTAPWTRGSITVQ